MRFSDFEKEAIQRLGIDYGWKKAFAEQAGYPDCVIIQRWRKAGTVPTESAKFLPNLKPEMAAKNRHVWGLSDYERLLELYESETPDTNIRDILRSEISPLITLGSVKRAKLNLRRGMRVGGVVLRRPKPQRRMKSTRRAVKISARAEAKPSKVLLRLIEAGKKELNW